MFLVVPTPQAVADLVSTLVYQHIKAKPAAVLGLATGGTMEPIYAALVAKLQQQPLPLEKLTTFNLDEYVGLSAAHPQSYHYFMQQHLFAPLGLAPSQVHLPDGNCRNSAEECHAYSEQIAAAGGLDLQLLGIGSNGHIGFNEPGTPFDCNTHEIELTPQTRQDNLRFFADAAEVPTHAITMGICEIMAAREVILVATGQRKADIIAQLYASGVDEQLPASVLKQHLNLKVIIDEDAAALLPTHLQQAG